MKSSYDKNRVSIIATGPVSTLGSGSVANNACRFLYSSLTDCAILAINSSMREQVSGPSKSPVRFRHRSSEELKKTKSSAMSSSMHLEETTYAASVAPHPSPAQKNRVGI